MTGPINLHNAAHVWQAGGASVVPVAADGSKRPAGPWKQYQTVPASPHEIDAWFKPLNPDGGFDFHTYGLGVVCGRVSNNLEMFEWEARAVDIGLPALMAQAMADHGQADLWNIVTMSGYAERTPSGGIHIYYRVVGETRGNTKLARRPATAAELLENPHDKVKVLIETRGEGGYSVVAPTPGAFHPTGKPWMVLAGTPDTIPTITAEQRDLIHAIANLFDQMPAPTPYLPDPHSNGHTNGAATNGAVSGTRPGDDYNTRTTWDDILTVSGWTRLRRIGGGWGWRRPGKTDPGISATTGTRPDIGDNLYVFSTSTDFDTERPYDKFGAYTHLNHSGDFKKAASTLSTLGYGERPKLPTITKPPRPTATKPATKPVASQTESPPAEVLADAPPPEPEPTPPPPPASGSLFDQTSPTELPPEPAATEKSLFEQATPDPDPDPDADQDIPRHTDTGDSLALIELHGDHLRFDCDRGRWLTWIGQQWELQPPGGGEARELAKDTATRITITPDDKAAVRHQHRALSAAGVSAALQSAQTDPRITIHTNQLDADPYLLGTPGGVVNLRTGELREGRPEDLISRCTNITPDYSETPQIWLDFLHTTFTGDEELIGYIRRIFGLALIGEVLEQILPFFYGQTGANGKSTILDTVQSILGISDRGYATSVPAEILMARKHEGHPTELAVMAGRRLVVASELEDGQRLAEARIKLITGRDVISARFLYGQPFSFTPTHLTIMVGNDKPHITVGGSSLWRRVESVPFDHQVEKADQDVTLPQKLIAVGGHILAWMIAGARDYLEGGGLRTPQAVKEATEEYQRDEDSVGRFIADRVHVGGPGKVAVKIFRAAYEKWCYESGDAAVSPKRLSKELEDKHHVVAKRGTAGLWSYTGVVIYTDEDNEDVTKADWHDR